MADTLVVELVVALVAALVAAADTWAVAVGTLAVAAGT